MSFAVTGTVKEVLQTKQGVSASGKEWATQEFILTTDDSNYPCDICFRIFGNDKITECAVKAGESLQVFFDIRSRDYNGRWFTDINVWKIDRMLKPNEAAQGVPKESQPQGNAGFQQPAQDVQQQQGNNNDLPF